MNACKNFSKAHPIILVILTLVFVYGIMHISLFIPSGPLKLAATEGIMAVLGLILAFLFMGKEKVSFSTKGLGYSFRSVRGYFIFMIIFAIYTIVGSIALSMQQNGSFNYQPITFVNIFLATIAIGIVEEITFRGLVFGGLLQKFGNTKRGIIFAAVLSGLLFGVMHVLGSILNGEVTSMTTAAMAVFKTVQAGIFGIVLAFIYYKTRNIYTVAALHALDDFLLLFSGSFHNAERVSYVTTKEAGVAAIAYIVFTVVVIPSLVRCIKNVTPKEAIPFDDDFIPRKVEFEKKTRKNR